MEHNENFERAVSSGQLISKKQNNIQEIVNSYVLLHLA